MSTEQIVVKPFGDRRTTAWRFRYGVVILEREYFLEPKVRIGDSWDTPIIVDDIDELIAVLQAVKEEMAHGR